ncbi:hypothetical protein Pcinc_022895 [Petrolisthes cinctipes]|uniref:Uncharacterized protein n=1 Tax=Petrolisthes cinctipes TaxID=88211 RepID=A0AAE1KHL4_PETCI|nr:hypothetical protein Pcinc_022895 [Petrolisthes cinctipes]
MAGRRRQLDHGHSLHVLQQQTSSCPSRSSGEDSFTRHLHLTYGIPANGPPIPITSNGVIGWRSSQPHLHLERYGTRR